MPGQSNLVKTVRLNEEELKAVLDRLDAAETQAVKRKRRSERFDYRVKNCVVNFHSSGAGSAAFYLVPTRNISAGGMAFLHGGFVYPGTHCVIQLISKFGSWKNVEARVARCDYVVGAVHEIGVAFSGEIDPAEFCTQAVKTRVLLAEDDASVAKIAKLFLSQLKAEVDYVENGALAVDLASQNIYDAILMDVDMPVLSGLDAVRKLREHGYSGVIVAVTSMTQPEDRDRCLNAGFDRYMPKPFDRDGIGELIESLKQEPLVSAFAQDPLMMDAVREYVMELPSRIRMIEDAVRGGDKRGLEKLCRGLKGEAGVFGFDPISSAAAQVEKLLIERGSESDLKRQVESLMKLCYLARSTPRRQQAQAAQPANSDAAAGPEPADPKSLPDQ
ncbi:MAG: response regulator [Phycisphaerae bacterium]|nr:response regulator [Phycisphaerae bacterium]